LVPSLYLKLFSRYLHLNTECAQTDGRKDGRKKASRDISPVHSVHLADITRPNELSAFVLDVHLVIVLSLASVVGLHNDNDNDNDRSSCLFLCLSSIVAPFIGSPAAGWQAISGPE